MHSSFTCVNTNAILNTQLNGKDMSNKTYYKTTFTITVLSEGPYTYSDLESLRHDVEDGDCIGKIETNSSDPLTAEQMRAALLDAGNDGTFFNLDQACCDPQ